MILRCLDTASSGIVLHLRSCSSLAMYSVGEHEAGHYTAAASHYQMAGAGSSLTSSANILNYDPSSPLGTGGPGLGSGAGAGAEHGAEQFQEGGYKREPSTPVTCPPLHSDYSSYPTPFTPSPSLSGSESPRTPNSYYQPSSAVSYPPVLEGGERLAVPYPAPTPPLSATHLAKEAQHALPDTEVKFSSQQIDCICDSLQQRKDMATLGKHC